MAALYSRKLKERQYTRIPLGSRTSRNWTVRLLYTLNLRPWETLLTLAETIGYGWSKSKAARISCSVVPSTNSFEVRVFWHRILSIGNWL